MDNQSINKQKVRINEIKYPNINNVLIKIIIYIISYNNNIGNNNNITIIPKTYSVCNSNIAAIIIIKNKGNIEKKRKETERERAKKYSQ